MFGMGHWEILIVLVLRFNLIWGKTITRTGTLFRQVHQRV